MSQTKTESIIFSVDANFVIQCRPPQDIAWEAVTTADEIVLLVTRTVQHEIDRLKQDGNSRRSRKARAFSSQMREMVQSPNYEIEVKADSPRIVYRLAPRIVGGQKREAELDLSVPDDRLIAETISASDTYPDVSILTHDTGPQLTARHLGIKFTQVPDDWLLEPEPTATSKAIAALERRIGSLESLRPQIGITLEGWSIENGPASWDWTNYSEPSSELTAEFVAMMVESNPLSRFEPRPSFDIYRSIGDDPHAYKDYEEKYDKWEEKLPQNFSSFLQKVARYAPAPVSTISVTNNGHVPAENLEIVISIEGGLLEPPKVTNVLAGKSPIPELGFPSAPKPPSRRSMLDSIGFPASSLLSLPEILQDQRRERDKFYWKPEKPKASVKSWNLECQEFRHKGKPKRFHVRARPLDDAERGVLTVSAHASNIVELVVLKVPFVITSVAGDAEDLFRRWSEDFS